jgi:hypothetical protein
MYPQGRLGGVKHGIVVCLLSLFVLLGCGLETFYYIDYIELSDYRNETFSRVQLPSDGSEGYGDNQYFNNFIIFYRIYLSDKLETGALNNSGDVLNSINTALLSDYNWSITYTNTNSTTVITSNLDNTFYSRRYFKLELEGARVDGILGRDALGKILEIRFPDPTDEIPVLVLGTDSYVLQRANPSSSSGTIFRPLPVDSRSFYNFPELCNSENATQEINADVASNSRGGEMRYTYVSMYIAAVGQSFEIPPTTVFSQPTFLGIFRLPDR